MGAIAQLNLPCVRFLIMILKKTQKLDIPSPKQQQLFISLTRKILANPFVISFFLLQLFQQTQYLAVCFYLYKKDLRLKQLIKY